MRAPITLTRLFTENKKRKLMQKDGPGLGLGWFGLGGCAAEVDDAPTVAETSPAASSSEPVTCDETSDETGGEHIGTSMNALTNGQRIAVCQAAALVAGSLGCAGVTASCAASAVLTVGSVTIPCVLVIAFACAAYVGGSSVIVTYCPEYVNR